MYKIWFTGYESPIGNFKTLTEARRELNVYKQEDKIECRQKFGTAQVTGSKDSYRVKFGMNLWSAAGIIKV